MYILIYKVWFCTIHRLMSIFVWKFDIKPKNKHEWRIVSKEKDVNLSPYSSFVIALGEKFMYTCDGICIFIDDIYKHTVRRIDLKPEPLRQYCSNKFAKNNTITIYCTSYQWHVLPFPCPKCRFPILLPQPPPLQPPPAPLPGPPLLPA